MPLHQLKIGEKLSDNRYEDLPDEVRAAYTAAEYVGAQYSEFPQDNTAVLMVKFVSGWDRWQRFDGVWSKT